jgi:hypothetical protein
VTPGAEAELDGARASDDRAGRERESLCPRCAFVKRIHTERGSTFWMCTLAASDPRFPRYPPQPVVSCPGFGE